MSWNFAKIKEQIQGRYIAETKHPEADLYIYNYTPQAQYERYWTPETLACRGLILDAQGTVAARPFPKFFNLEEYQDPIPVEPFQVYEKLDGSLGILYFAHGKPRIATRGSFTSDQALKATELLYKQYLNSLGNLDPRLTYLFEIIYPQNRIVVDYGGKEMLTLLTVIETVTGQELPLPNIGFPLVKCYDGIDDLSALKAFETENQEGFVIRFQSGLRLKVKFEEYKRLHRIVTQVSTKTIWEYLRDGRPLEGLLDRVPDEFYDWVKATKASLEAQYAEIEDAARSEFKDLGNRKENAFYYQTCTYPGILFSMLDGKDYSQAIWRMVKPDFEKPFKGDEDP
ncbi:MAG: T4 RnlA family RNA ligase [Anaerolineae bacterium]|nr:T4 RnlA family RNA ligase [Gloeobacterales cyanobacterium ES-bin-313]